MIRRHAPTLAIAALSLALLDVPKAQAASPTLDKIREVGKNIKNEAQRHIVQQGALNQLLADPKRQEEKAASEEPQKGMFRDPATMFKRS